MKIKTSYIILILSLSIAMSCQKNKDFTPARRGVDIALRVNTPEDISTKGEIQDKNIEFIELFATGNGTNLFSSENSPSKKLNKPASGTIWILSDEKNTYTWQENHSYTFYAYTHSKVTASDSHINISEAGKTIEVRQPADYNQTIDYLLSYNITEPASASHAVIPIMLEHAMAKVSICVTRAESMKNVEISNLRIKFHNIKLISNMRCLEISEWKDNTAKPNIWTNKLGLATANYELLLATNADVNTKVTTPDLLDWSKPTMTFIANPVDNSGLKDYAVSLSYDVTAPNTAGVSETHTYSRTFALQDITKQWENSHIIRYLFRIDNGIHLTGSISEWKNVDYIEGTILPPIVNE